MDTSGFPDTYTRSLGVEGVHTDMYTRSLGAEGVHIRQITSAHGITDMCHSHYLW